VITFDNRGVGASSGAPATSIEQMATDAITFIKAMGFEQVDRLKPTRNTDDYRVIEEHFARLNRCCAYERSCFGIVCGARPNRFPTVRLQPLGHLSARVESIAYRGSEIRSTADCDVTVT
jgi:hypothetical protein